MMASLSKLSVTWFGAGLIPVMPGTFGSFAALPFAWIIVELLGNWWFFAIFVIILTFAFFMCSRYLKEKSETDPQEIVIDEVVGQWLTLMVFPADLIYYCLGFVFFRFFDILKPWPISWLDSEFDNSFGIIIDDLVAGGYALVLLYPIYFLLEY